LGHPPFGHTGERTLHDLMQPYGGFEGNAQTLRILTQTIFSEGREGMNPSRALLDAVLKYKTLHAEAGGARNHYLYTEQEQWLDFTLGGQAFPPELIPGDTRNSFKSIECQIMDWADDTAYSLNDLADGIHAGFIHLGALERWAEEKQLDAAAAEHVTFLCKAIRERRVEARLNRMIGSCIAAARLESAPSFLSAMSKRHAYQLHIDPAVQAHVDVNKRISLDLVFRHPTLQQLDHKAAVILKRMFEVLRDRYIEGGKGLRLLPADVEQQIEEAPSATHRARLICDWIANMTDRFAFRTYRRLFDADYGSITDLV
jgi:dGTPase